MEGELWPILYAWVAAEATLRPRRKRVRYGDGVILLVVLWAALHDRPLSWACRAGSWGGEGALPWESLPSPATLSRRTRQPSFWLLFAALFDAVRAADGPPPLVRVVDAKPEPVSGFSKDRDAKWGWATDAKAKGYKLFAAWNGRRRVPDAWVVGPMNRAEPEAAAASLAPQLDGTGYVLGDVAYDTNPAYAAMGRRGFQLLAARKCPGAGLGHGGPHAPERLRSIGLLETPAAGDLPGAGPTPFARELYALRGGIERRFGHCGNFGGGLEPLPNWVRRPRRVAMWNAAKLLINAARLTRNQGLAA
jgi:Transposase DDE domain